MQKSKVQFKSSNSFYLVECEVSKKDRVETYVNKIESFIPSLKEVFHLVPSHQQLNVIFGDMGTLYSERGLIYISDDLDLTNPENIYGGLFHETTHGFLEKYIYRPHGVNYFPESCAIILQIAALDKINTEWASKFASGFGSSEDNHTILFELVRIYRENGFDSIRSIYTEMGKSDVPISHQATLVDDLNSILRNFNVKINL